jgi:hypothetical protein
MEEGSVKIRKVAVDSELEVIKSPSTLLRLLDLRRIAMYQEHRPEVERDGVELKEEMMIPMRKVVALGLLTAGLVVAANLKAAENLRLNPRLDYSSDSQDGRLITGDHLEDGAVRGKPNYVFMFGEG